MQSIKEADRKFILGQLYEKCRTSSVSEIEISTYVQSKLRDQMWLQQASQLGIDIDKLAQTAQTNPAKIAAYV